MSDRFDLSRTMDLANGLAVSAIGRDYSLADWKYEKLKEQIIEFQADLPDSVDVVMQLAAFGQTIIMNVDESKNYPCNSEMIEYLESNEEVRRYVWQRMKNPDAAVK